MVLQRRALALSAWSCVALGCAPHSAPEPAAQAEEAEPDPAPVIEPAPVAPVQPPPVPEPATPQPPSEPPTPEPSSPAVAAETVTPSVHIRFEDEDEYGCLGIAGASDVPAYDPDTGRVLLLETYVRKMSIEREAELVWYDAATGETLRREDLLADASSATCAQANRKARRRSRALNGDIEEGSWEAMTPVPIRRVHEDAYDNLRAELAEDYSGDEDAEQLLDGRADWVESLMPRGQVHVVARNTGTVVRLPGVKVYERDVAIRPNTLATLFGHRPSGVVVAVHADCRDEEDCTCNLEDSATVMRWSPATLAAIDDHPCGVSNADDGDSFACELGSIFDG